MHKENYEALLAQYKDPKSLMYKKLRSVDEYINTYIEDSNSNYLLDIGMGIGELIHLEKDKFRFICGVDIDSEGVDYCKNRFLDYDNIEIILSDLKQIDSLLFKSKFDVITCLDVLEHIKPDDCINTLNCIHNLLNEDGLFIFTGPGIFEKIRIKLGLSPTHMHSHSSYSWAKLISESGYKILHVESIEFPILDNELLRNKMHLFGKCCLIVAKRY